MLYFWIVEVQPNLKRNACLPDAERGSGRGARTFRLEYIEKKFFCSRAKKRDMLIFVVCVTTNFHFVKTNEQMRVGYLPQTGRQAS